MKKFTVIVELRIDANTDVQAAERVAHVVYQLTEEVKMITSEDENLFELLAEAHCS